MEDPDLDFGHSHYVRQDFVAVFNAGYEVQYTLQQSQLPCLQYGAV